jgi:hypothetical protein
LTSKSKAVVDDVRRRSAWTPCDAATSLPERGGWRNSNGTRMRFFGGSSFSILSSFLTRDLHLGGLGGVLVEAVDEALLLRASPAGGRRRPPRGARCALRS